ncbi:periplasmic heavy metal sensor [Acidisoma cellulosilytica]|uniref:Periplasmic heavy metal sensor n=1 Tax=Acidisoma cellulosilyticum TaxID=2802395 RepID=A0A964E5E8_9PROT|nr:periplasmic heavy metal sensor [Acidisoma cellulosilyticum]MCB8881898.1 periplasmic heavy metal sensor [Acidisoma cellulosilyticum]
MVLRTPPCWTRAKIALSVSVIINLFLVALIGSHIWRVESQRRFDNPLAQALATAEHSLPPKDAKTFRQVIKSESSVFAGSAQRLASARHAVGQAISAEPYDPAAVSQSLNNWRSDWNQFFDVFRGPLVDALGAVSPEGRRKLIADRDATRKSMHETGFDP